MSRSDDLDAIREQKREQLAAQLADESGEDESQSADSPDTPIHINGPDHLAEVTNTHDVVLVDFFAEWCGPCKMLEPTLEELAAETDAAIAKVDIDQHQRLAAQYGVQGVPNLVLFAAGSPTERIVGAQPKSQFEQLLGKYT